MYCKQFHRFWTCTTVLLLSGGQVLAKRSWEEQQARAEQISAEYQEKHPNIRSDRFVFRTVVLPEGKPLELDLRIVRPRQGGPFPVVFYVHGGAWGTGSKSQFTHESYVLAERGIAGVRLEYRWKIHGAKYPEAIADVLDAIDFVRQRANELKVDFSRVGLAGGSAGGHLSSMAAQLTPECICYDGFNGLFDAFDRNGSRFGGGDYTGTTEAEKKRASAIYNIKDNPPDTLLYHGTADTTVDIRQAYRFAEAIRNKGGHAVVLDYVGAEHAFFNKEPYQTKTTQAMLDHVSFVFGLSDQAPDLSTYVLPPAIAKQPEGFSILGKWFREDRPSREFEFSANQTVLSPAGETLEWTERDGRYYIIWRSGSRRQIELLDAKSIRIGENTYRSRP